MSMGCSTMTDLKINDMDIAEINGFGYIKILKIKNLQLMVKIDSYDDESTSNSIVAVGAN